MESARPESVESQAVVASDLDVHVVTIFGTLRQILGRRVFVVRASDVRSGRMLQVLDVLISNEAGKPSCRLDGGLENQDVWVMDYRYHN